MQKKGGEEDFKRHNTTKKKNKSYDGRDVRRENTGRPVEIEVGSVDEALLADWMEDNLGFRQTTIFLNQHRTDEGRQPVGRSAVMAAFDRMNPKIDRVAKVVQGGGFGRMGRDPKKTSQIIVDHAG